LVQAALVAQMLMPEQMVLLDRIPYSAPLLAQVAVKAYLETSFPVVLEETAAPVAVEQEVQVAEQEIRPLYPPRKGQTEVLEITPLRIMVAVGAAAHLP
jgi:hypothetical protein